MISPTLNALVIQLLARILSDQQWQRLQPLLLKLSPKGGRPANDHCTTINGILWILRTDAPWRDLPDSYGAWETVAGGFYAWRKSGLWQH